MQKNSLAGKVALITGAARRVGAEIARVLHEAL
jgi:NAD(P)-dependent dehydrogenase (short-subunit alcohol dehydrogenase family)